LSGARASGAALELRRTSVAMVFIRPLDDFKTPMMCENDGARRQIYYIARILFLMNKSNCRRRLICRIAV